MIQVVQCSGITKKDKPRFNFVQRLHNFPSKIMQAVTELANAAMLLHETDE